VTSSCFFVASAGLSHAQPQHHLSPTLASSCPWVADAPPLYGHCTSHFAAIQCMCFQGAGPTFWTQLEASNKHFLWTPSMVVNLLMDCLIKVHEQPFHATELACVSFGAIVETLYEEHHCGPIPSCSAHSSFSCRRNLCHSIYTLPEYHSPC
jgi:hypothetical protein